MPATLSSDRNWLRRFDLTVRAVRRGALLAAPVLALILAPCALALDGDTVAARDTAAPAVVRYDTSVVKPRLPSSTALARYRADSRFNYGRDFREPETLWERFRRWLSRLWNSIFDTEGKTTFWTVVSWVILLGSFIFVVLKLVGVDIRGIFLGEKRGRQRASILESGDIESIDFPSMVAVAERDGNLREATRLHYLWTLQVLSGREIIVWRPDKTDLDYARELRESPLRGPFEKAALLFDYVWYGDVPIDTEIYPWVRDTIAAVRGSV